MEGDHELVMASYEIARGVVAGLRKSEWLVLMSMYFSDLSERSPAAFEAVVRGYAGEEEPPETAQ